MRTPLGLGSSGTSSASLDAKSPPRSLAPCLLSRCSRMMLEWSRPFKMPQSKSVSEETRSTCSDASGPTGRETDGTPLCSSFQAGRERLGSPSRPRLACRWLGLWVACADEYRVGFLPQRSVVPPSDG